MSGGKLMGTPVGGWVRCGGSVTAGARFADIFGGQGMGRNCNKRENLGEDEDCLVGESTSAYSARIGKWSREALEALASPTFWAQLLTSHTHLEAAGPQGDGGAAVCGEL